MPQLNNFKKIIIATGHINYLASVIETVQLELNGIAAGFAEKQMQEKEDLFETIVTCLSTAIEELAAFTEDHEMVVPIDQRILSVPLEILILGMDDEEETYQDYENDQP